MEDPSLVSLEPGRSSRRVTSTPFPSLTPFHYCPEVVLLKIFGDLSIEDLKQCRLACSRWDELILLSELLDMKSCFVFDGRRDDTTGGRCASYMAESPSKNYYWSHLKFRRVGPRQTPWLAEHLEGDANFTLTISVFELLNCTLNWSVILQIMIHLPNLEVFVDRQDTYCWDYQTFNSGIEEDESISDNSAFQQLRSREKLDNLRKLKVARIHRSQLIECTTYLKMLQLRSANLQELEITTDQNFAPQRANLFYRNLHELLRRIGNSVKILRFPYKLVCPTYDFRVTDEHHAFREFLNHMTEHRWPETLALNTLEQLSLQYGVVPIEGQDWKSKLAPFLKSLPSLKTVSMRCVFLESGMEHVVEEYIREFHHQPKPPTHHYGIYMNDAVGVPNILGFQTNLTSISFQTFRESGRQLKNLIPLLGTEVYEELTELQYFSKNHTFRNFNLDLLTKSFCNLTHLNLVDHNSRLETRHGCEALATIEDEDMQLIIKSLRKLVSLQLIANMTFLTDSGLTGFPPETCRTMYRYGNFVLTESDVLEGVPISSLQRLRYLVLRGMGIKVTDITALYAFNGMQYLKKLHIYGSHQFSSVVRTTLSQRFTVGRGCDIQV